MRIYIHIYVHVKLEYTSLSISISMYLRLMNDPLRLIHSFSQPEERLDQISTAMAPRRRHWKVSISEQNGCLSGGVIPKKWIMIEIYKWRLIAQKIISEQHQW